MLKKELLDHLEEHLGFKPIDHAFWSDLSKNAQKDPFNFITFVNWFSDVYHTIDLTFSGYEDEADAFCSKLISYCAVQTLTDYQWEKSLDKIFQQWTRCGIRDIAENCLLPLLDPLGKLLSSGLSNQITVMYMVYRSPKLWNVFRERILENPSLAETNVYKAIIHKYEPHRTEVYVDLDIEALYYLMFLGDYGFKPTLIDLKLLLAGTHNNAIAWNTAFEAYADGHMLIGGEWIKMLPAFSSLKLDPKDQDAWRFWHSLCECCANDASGQELLAFLAEDKKDMASAFANGWSIVDALYEGDERYAHAAKIDYSFKEHSLKLPGVEW